MLAYLPGRSAPVHPQFVALIYELASLRLLPPFWPTSDRYCRLASPADASVMIRTRSLEHASLLAHHVAYVATLGQLAAPWRVVLTPHIAGAAETTTSIEPAEPGRELAALAGDLACIALALASSVRRLARIRLFCLRRGTAEGAPAALSAREREVLDLFLAGMSPDTIARRLFISLHTARNHLKHVNAKLGVSSQRELRELFAETLE